jgi:hypothetical protein
VAVASREELFARALDDMLAGKAPGAAASAEEEGLLAFGQRMAGLRPSPRPAFYSGLKSQLLQQLAEKGAERPWQERLSPLFRRPLFAAAAAAVSVAAIFGGLWLSGVFSPSQPAAPEVVRVEAMTDRTVYARGQPVVINVGLQNLSGGVLDFSEFPPIVSVMRETGIMAAYTFGAGAGTKTLQPGQAVSFSLTWDQRDSRGVQVAPGEYYLELEDLYYQGAKIELTPQSPVEFEIV